jgi:hypothetical protein
MFVVGLFVTVFVGFVVVGLFVTGFFVGAEFTTKTKDELSIHKICIIINRYTTTNASEDDDDNIFTNHDLPMPYLNLIPGHITYI